MISLQLLETDDVIKADDWVRQLDITQEGQSDYIAFTSPYSGRPINRMRWQRVDFFCPFWAGKTVGEFENKMTEGMVQRRAYEIVRGAMPESHKVVVEDR